MLPFSNTWSVPSRRWHVLLACYLLHKIRLVSNSACCKPARSLWLLVYRFSKAWKIIKNTLRLGESETQRTSRINTSGYYLPRWMDKKSQTASFLCISACFFNPQLRLPVDAILSLGLLQQSHTGEILASCLEQTLYEWWISTNKVLHIVSDNGANMIKAIRLMQEKKQRNTV